MAEASLRESLSNSESPTRRRVLLACVVTASLLLLGSSAFAPATTATPAAPRVYNEIEYTRFQRKVAAVAAAPSRCERPPRSVYLTVLTSGFFPFRQLQERAMRLVPSPHDCLAAYFVTACLDERSLALCERAGLRHCAALDNASLLEPRAPMWTPDYRYINLVKLQVLQKALEVAEHVLFLDSDVLLFRPPWPALGAPFPLRFQTEQAKLPGGTRCEEDEANGGVLLLSRAGTGQALHAFFDAFFAHRQEMLHAREMNATDQAFLLPAARSAGLGFCGLPSDVFVGQCQLGRDGVANYSAIVTYHPTCLAQHRKARRMKAAMAATARAMRG